MDTFSTSSPSQAWNNATSVSGMDSIIYLLAPLGRILFSMIFIMSGIAHFTAETIGYAEQSGIPAAGFLVPVSGILAIVGGLSILVGYYTRLGAFLIILFLIPVTLMMHNFWEFADPAMRQMQQTQFMKNLSMLGGALMIACYGAGPISFDSIRDQKPKHRTT